MKRLVLRSHTVRRQDINAMFGTILEGHFIIPLKLTKRKPRTLGEVCGVSYFGFMSVDATLVSRGPF
jgi:hypothetical protein